MPSSNTKVVQGCVDNKILAFRDCVASVVDDDNGHEKSARFRLEHVLVLPTLPTATCQSRECLLYVIFRLLASHEKVRNH